MNNDSNNDLARYHGFPPLSPPHEPTPTIPQMADKHEQETFADDVMQYLHWATCVVGGVVITTFIVALLFRLVVGVY